MNKIYLAGPITGNTHETVTEWRDLVTWSLQDAAKCYSPMRGKDYLKNAGVIADVYSDILMSSSKAVWARDMWDVERCDILFANLLGAKRVSIGTVMEITFAWSLRKPIIVVMEKDNIHQHGMLKEAAGWVVDTVEDGIEVARKLIM